jgi:hypothetical protein
MLAIIVNLSMNRYYFISRWALQKGHLLPLRRNMSSSYWSSPLSTPAIITSSAETGISSSSSTKTVTEPSWSSAIYKYNFDTDVFVDKLEKQGYSRKQSEGILILLMEVIRERYKTRSS